MAKAVRVMNKGYGEAGASWTKRSVKGFTAQSGSPHEDINQHNSTLRQRARMLYMAAPIATSAINTNRTNVIGIGLKPKSTIDRDRLGLSAEAAEEWQKKAEAEFALWATRKKACDATGMNDFYAMQQLALISWLTSGDIFALFKQYPKTFLEPYSLRVHLIEADRVATPIYTGSVNSIINTLGETKKGNKVYDGVEVDKEGRVVAYHIRNTYPLQFSVKSTKWKRVEAYGKLTGLPNIVQVMNSERPDQYRGVSYLAQVIEPLLQLRRYTESELISAIIESFFTAFVKTETDPSDMPFNQVENGLEESEESEDTNEYEMGPGQINIMKKGEDVVFADPKRPAKGFDTFFRSICTQVGAALEIPADLLLKAFNASYSASRAALLEAWKSFKMRREWFANDFCRPIYEMWMAEAVARGRIDAPGFFTDPSMRAAWLGCEWIGPSQGQLDPVKEITAEILAVAEGFTTREQSTIRLNGGQWEANVEQLARENAKLAEANGVEQGEGVTLSNAIKAVILEAMKEGDDNGNKKKSNSNT